MPLHSTSAVLQILPQFKISFLSKYNKLCSYILFLCDLSDQKCVQTDSQKTRPRVTLPPVSSEAIVIMSRFIHLYNVQVSNQLCTTFCPSVNFKAGITKKFKPRFSIKSQF